MAAPHLDGPLETTFRIEGTAAAHELDAIRRALGDIGLRCPAILLTGEDSSLTEQGFRKTMLTFVEPQHGGDFSEGWFISWDNFRGFSLAKCRSTEQKSRVQQHSVHAFKRLLSLSGNASIPAQRRSPFWDPGEQERLVDPQSLIDAMREPGGFSQNKPTSIGLTVSVRESPSYYLIKNYAQALNPTIIAI